MGLAEVQTQDGKDVDASIHARHDGEMPTRARVGHVGACGGVGQVGAQEVGDPCHASGGP